MKEATHTRRYSIGLLIAAAAIIATGVALKPPDRRPETPVSELESARLRRLAQERRLQELGDYISYAAQSAAKSLVYVPDLRQTAVAIDARTAATGLRVITSPQLSAASGSGDRFVLGVQRRRPDVPVLLLRPEQGSLPAAARAVVDTGDWVVAVALRDDGAPIFAYGLYENAADSRCGSLTYTRLRASIPLTAAFIGGGLFSLRGGLAGIIARCDSEVVVLSVSSVADALSRPVPPNDWLQDRYGVRVRETDGPAVEIVTVWTNSQADLAGIRPGDVVTEVDGRPVTNAADAVSTLDAEGDHTLTVRRGRRTIKSRVAPPPAPEEIRIPGAGIVLVDAPQGIVVRSVAENGPAAQAGVLSGDVVRRLGSSAPRSAARIVDAFSGGKPVVLTLERDGSNFDVRFAP